MNAVSFQNPLFAGFPGGGYWNVERRSRPMFDRFGERGGRSLSRQAFSGLVKAAEQNAWRRGGKIGDIDDADNLSRLLPRGYSYPILG